MSEYKKGAIPKIIGQTVMLFIRWATRALDAGLSRCPDSSNGLIYWGTTSMSIMMTILSFVFGVIPLAVASGAGAMTMKSIGVVVLGGMIAATFISTMLVPVVYVLLETMRELVVDVEEEVKNREMI